MKYQQAVVGFSVNPEIELAISDTPGPKKVLRHMEVCLSGSSGNVAIAVKKLGARSHLLGLVAADPNLRTVQDSLLSDAIRKSKVPFTPIRVLAETNVCVIPVIGETNGEAWGKRNEIVHSAIPQALQDLTKPKIGIGPQTFAVITGLRSVEMVFAKALLERTQAGFRVLNAKDTLCRKAEFKKILPLVDLLVLNRHEFHKSGMTLQELNDLGPKIVVVTCDKEGGFFWFSSFPRGKCFPVSFSSVHFPGGRFETGAGDWFLGAMISELIKLDVTAHSVTPEEFQKVVNFAAKVAGKKITMPGGGNGPSRLQLR